MYNATLAVKSVESKQKGIFLKKSLRHVRKSDGKVKVKKKKKNKQKKMSDNLVDGIENKQKNLERQTNPWTCH